MSWWDNVFNWFKHKKPQPIPVPPPVPVPQPVPTPAGVIFNGDYSTGNFSQWPAVHNRDVNHTGAHYDAQGWTYPARIIADSARGNVARYEVRKGDPGIYQADGPPRSEVAVWADKVPGMDEGRINWQRFSVKFDSSFPLNNSNAIWVVTNQWHSNTDGSPPISLCCVTNGRWTLRVFKYNNPPAQSGSPQADDIWSTPLDLGNWHDVVMQVYWSASDDLGFIRLWHNGIRQIFSNGQNVYQIRTLMPGGGANYYKEGIYREDRPETAIVYHQGYQYTVEALA